MQLLQNWQLGLEVNVESNVGFEHVESNKPHHCFERMMIPCAFIWRFLSLVDLASLAACCRACLASSTRWFDYSFELLERLNIRHSPRAIIKSAEQLDFFTLLSDVLWVTDRGLDSDASLRLESRGVRCLRLGQGFRGIVSALPGGLRSLDIQSPEFNQPLPLPPSLSRLTFWADSQFNQPLDLPQGLLVLKLGQDFNQPLLALPSSLKQLRLGDAFNQALELSSTCLEYLDMWSNCRFDEPLDQLPDSLLTLRTGQKFNQSLDKLPQSLTSLTLGYSFEQPIDCLPATLRVLRLGSNFNLPIDHLPDSLQILGLGFFFNQKIHRLPEGLQVVEHRCQKSVHELPPNFTEVWTSTGAFTCVKSWAKIDGGQGNSPGTSLATLSSESISR